MLESAEGENGKGRKRPSAKAGSAAARQTMLRAKCTIHLSVEASQRLDIHATMMNLDRSSLVEQLINTHLRRYVVQDRQKPDATACGEAAA